MIIKSAPLRPIPSFLLPFTQSTSTQTRYLHDRIRAARAPAPTPFVPDVQTFLTVIGRNLSQHASKIPSWEALFTLSSTQLRELGIEPPRSRRYLLAWRERFRQGKFGVGGNLRHVQNGEALLSVVEVPTQGSSAETATATVSPGKRKIVVNVKDPVKVQKVEGLEPVPGFKVKGAHTIIGPRVQPIKGGKGAKIVVQEGLWEHRRGHKIDGGERRRAEVRDKKMREEKNAR
jgi:hypothetical protein